VLAYKSARDAEDERHVHPLQLDVIDRALVLWSNPGETILTPFMGVGSEVYAAVMAGRKAIGVELKPSYYRQALKNIAVAEAGIKESPQGELFDNPEVEEEGVDLTQYYAGPLEDLKNG
jgi:DNA modification methylase